MYYSFIVIWENRNLFAPLLLPSQAEATVISFFSTTIKFLSDLFMLPPQQIFMSGSNLQIKYKIKQYAVNNSLVRFFFIYFLFCV